MRNMKLLFLLMAVVFVSGCTKSMDITNISDKIPQINSFMEEYPNAEITAVKLSNDTVGSIIGQVREDCDPSIPIKSYWRVKMHDPDSNISATMWMEADTMDVICISKSGGIVKDTNNSVMVITGSVVGVVNNESEDIVENDTLIKENVTGDEFNCSVYSDVYDNWIYNEKMEDEWKCDLYAKHECQNEGMRLEDVSFFDHKCCMWSCISKIDEIESKIEELESKVEEIAKDDD